MSEKRFKRGVIRTGCAAVAGMMFLSTAAIGLALVVIAVLLHHEALRVLVTSILPRMHRSPRWQGCIIVLTMMLAHILEVLLFAAGMFLAAEVLELGYVVGEDASVTTWCYFSFTSYTSLGIGDIVPHGHIRLLVGIEALVGLVLIGWTASFLLIEMRERRASIGN